MGITNYYFIAIYLADDYFFNDAWFKFLADLNANLFIIFERKVWDE